MSSRPLCLSCFLSTDVISPAVTSVTFISQSRTLALTCLCIVSFLSESVEVFTLTIRHHTNTLLSAKPTSSSFRPPSSVLSSWVPPADAQAGSPGSFFTYSLSSIFPESSFRQLLMGCLVLSPLEQNPTSVAVPVSQVLSFLV